MWGKHTARPGPLAVAFLGYFVGAALQRAVALPVGAVTGGLTAAIVLLLVALFRRPGIEPPPAPDRTLALDDLDAWAEAQEDPRAAATERAATQHARARRRRWRAGFTVALLLGAFTLGARRQALLDAEHDLVGAMVGSMVGSMVGADFGVPASGKAASIGEWDLEGRVSAQPRDYASGAVAVRLGELRVRPAAWRPRGESGFVSLPGFAHLGLSAAAAADAQLRDRPPEPNETMRYRGELEFTAAPALAGTNAWALSLATQRVYLSAYARSGLQVERPAPDEAAPAPGLLVPLAALRGWVWSVHRRAARFIETEIADPARRGTVQTLLLGQSPWVGDALRDDYRKTGLIHLFAVSGLHTGLLAALIFGLGRLAGLDLRGSSWLVVACLPVYLTVIGFRPSAMRAAVMTIAVLMPHLASIGTGRLNALALAAWAIVLLRPEALWQPGFQLSFTAVAALMFLPRPLFATLAPPERWTRPWRGKLAYRAASRFLFQPVVYCLAVPLAMLPLQAIYQLPVPLLGVFANIPAIPLATLTLGFGFLGATLGLVLPVVGAGFLWMASATAGLQNAWVAAVAGLAEASTEIAPLAPGIVVAYYAILFVGPHVATRAALPWYPAMARSQMLLRTAALALLVTIARSQAAGPPAPGRGGALHVAFLDVEQGDSTVLRLPSGATVLIDGGTREPVDRGRTTVLPYLRAHGVRRLDAVIATHNDADHIGGLVSVLKAMPVDLLVDLPGDPRDSDTFRAWEAARLRALRIVPGERGLMLKDDAGVALYVLSPDGGAADKEWVAPNERSVVLLIDYGASEVMLTGDAGAPTEQTLARLGLLVDLDALKAGHHGSDSAGSITFLRRVAPELVVISCGTRNPYHHPHPEALERYGAVATEVFVTASGGSLERDFWP